jgi:hypothetical protein
MILPCDDQDVGIVLFQVISLLIAMHNYILNRSFLRDTKIGAENCEEIISHIKNQLTYMSLAQSSAIRLPLPGC